MNTEINSEKHIQALQSILLADNLPKDIDCIEWGNFNHQYRLFYIAVNGDKFPILGVGSVECFVLMNLKTKRSIYIDCEHDFYGYSDHDKTYIDLPFSGLRSQLKDLDDIWFNTCSPVRYDDEKLVQLFNEYNSLIDPELFYEIKCGEQIAELG